MNSMSGSYELMIHFLEVMVSERNLSALTVQAYKRDLEVWLSFWGNRPLDQVESRHRQDYIDYLKMKGLGSRSVARHLSSCQQFLRFLISEQRLARNPWSHLGSVTYTSPLPHVVSIEDIQNLLKTSSTDSSPEGIRLWTLLEMLYATGMRVSELVSLPLLDGSKDSFMIRGKGGHERWVFLTPQALEALNRYLSVRPLFLPGTLAFNKYLFPSRSSEKGHLTRQRFGQLLQGLAERCGLSNGVSPHGIRHAFATHLLAQGVDLITLKQLLGHQDISTTQIYTRVDAEKWSALLATHHPLGGLDKELHE
jgi:integrase/recombinase XerD